MLSRLRAAGLHRAGREDTDALLVGDVVRRAVLDLDARASSLQIERPEAAHKAGMPKYISTQKRYCVDFETCPEPNKGCMERIRPEGRPVSHLLVASERIGGSEDLSEDLRDGATVTLTPDFRLAIQGAPPEWVAPEMPRGSAAQ